MAYYDDKIEDLQQLFGTDDVKVGHDSIRVGEAVYEVQEDVIVALAPERRPMGRPGRVTEGFAPDIQCSFGREWDSFDEILPEHRQEFEAYFDLIDLDELADALVCDLGCGMGRWSYFLAPSCRRLVLVDFSDAIFVARRNLEAVSDAIFVMGDVTQLPFADNCCDLAFSIGVMHHLPTDALDAVRSLRRFSPQLLVYLYYSLDNRPAHFRVLLRLVTAVRRRTARVENEQARSALTHLIAYTVYLPLVRLGRALSRIGLQRLVPLADTYAGKSTARIRQDVYDRFFTSIEQRVSRRQIEGLEKDFSSIQVSDSPPFWHFRCLR